jgi:quercetin dioxygenase-like cupin family protein
MAYAPSPRPVFDGPSHIPYANITRHLWGDPEAGEVADWIYVSSAKIHQIIFGLAPGGSFRHSDSFRTIFGADELLYVVSGVMILTNPETGEVHRVRTGEAVFFRKDTWHHAYNFGQEPLRVLEYFAPPPSQGTSGAYARTKPLLEVSRYTQDELLGRLPMEAPQARAAQSMKVLREADLFWRLEGKSHLMLVGLLAATEHLTVGKAILEPGEKSDPEQHGGDESIYVLEGTLNIYLPEQDGQRWFELQPGDGFYLPEGTPHQYYNVSSGPAAFLFGVVPHYHPQQDR